MGEAGLDVRDHGTGHGHDGGAVGGQRDPPGGAQRAGDKGDTLILAVIAWGGPAHRTLVERLTEEVVTAAYAPLLTGPVSRNVLPQLHAMVFTLPGVLGGGVTGSPVLDGHGKTMSYHLATVRL